MLNRCLVLLVCFLLSESSLAFCDMLNVDVFTVEIREKIITAARKNITKAVLNDGSNVKAENVAQKRSTIIDPNWESCTVAAGFASAQAELCHLDYQTKIYKPFMKYFRDKASPSDKQSSYIGLLHGISLGVASSSLKENNFVCSEKIKANLVKIKFR